MGFIYVGALWKQEGKDFLTGYVNEDIAEKTKIFVFTNKRKSKDNQPDYQIAIGDDKGDYYPQSKKDAPF